jgi:hypothetical protein
MSRSDNTSQLTLWMFAKEVDGMSAEFAKTKANGDGGKKKEKRNIFDIWHHPQVLSATARREAHFPCRLQALLLH